MRNAGIEKMRTSASRMLVVLCCAFVLAAACCLCACSSGTGNQAAKEAQITVSVTVEASTADRGMIASTTVQLPKESSVYDALCATGVTFNDAGGYVSSIEGLAAGDYGATSGWAYTVNGEMVWTACQDYKLADGDAVVWTYILSF